MTLKQIVSVLKKNIVNLNFAQKAEGNTYTFSQLNRFREAVNELHEAGLLDKLMQEARNSAVFKTQQDSMTLVITEAQAVGGLRQKINSTVENMLEALSKVIPEEKENSISVKLPDVNDFRELSEVAEKFDKILSQSILDAEIGGQVHIEYAYNGSIWFDIFVESSAAVLLIAGIAWAAAVIYKKIQEGKIFDQHVESLKIKNESLSDIRDAQKRLIELMIDSEAKNLANEHFKSQDPERTERLKFAIKTLSELMNKGAEVHPSLSAPETVSNLFPDIKNLIGVLSRTKQLN